MQSLGGEMLNTVEAKSFPVINPAYNRTFVADRLTVGLVVPIENYAYDPAPMLNQHVERIALAETLGFTAVWIRDVPFNVPSFGDAGQMHDPFVYLGYIAAQTQRIGLGIASIILPLRHPAHVAKAAASIDVLSEGRLLLGVASGDRPEEYPALNHSFADRGARFRSSFDYIKQTWNDSPSFQNEHGQLGFGIDMLPKPYSLKLPLLITGGSQQSTDWITKNGDGWMLYPRDTASQAVIIKDWHSRLQALGRPPQPIMQPLYIDLSSDCDQRPHPIHLGYRMGTRHLVEYLKSREEIGVNHVALNLRFNQLDIESTMHRLAEEILPEFTI